MGETIQTTLGTLSGGREEDVLVFRGIPYGAPTGGEHRFRPPRPAAPNGDPNGPELPVWPAYDTNDRATLNFDVPCRVENDPRAEREIWRGSPAPGL